MPGLCSCVAYGIAHILHGYVSLMKDKKKSTIKLVISLKLHESSSGSQQYKVNVHEPEMHISSHRTMTIDWPASNSFETILHKRPRRWSRPSMILVADNTMAFII